MKLDDLKKAAELTQERNAYLATITTIEDSTKPLFVNIGRYGLIGNQYEFAVKSPKVEGIIRTVMLVEFRDMLADVERRMKEIGLEI